MKKYIKADIVDILEEAPEVQLDIAQSPKTNARTLARLANSEDFNVLYAVAVNPNTSPETLKVLYETGIPGVCVRVSRSPFIGIDLMEEMASIGDSHAAAAIKVGLATNICLPNRLIRVLAEDNNWRVRETIASRKTIPSEILSLLSHDDKFEVLIAVAANENASEDTLEFLSNSEYDWVRAQVAANPHTPRDVLKQMADDPHEAYTVQAEARRALGYPGY